MSIPMKHCTFLIIFCQCFSFTLLYTNNVPWNSFDKIDVLDVSQKIEITCAGPDKLPNFTTIKVSNPHKHIFMNNCSWNKTYFQNTMEIIGKQKIVKLYLRGKENATYIFEEGYFANLTALKTLEIMEHKIPMFDESVFNGQKSIIYLNISDNELVSVTSKTFESMSKMRSLYLSYNRLQHLPDDIFKPIFNLYSLRIDNNELSNLTKNVFKNLTNLRVLNLGNNRISHLDEDVFLEVGKLENISLSNNRILAFPERMFANNTQLKKVFMTNATGQNNTNLPENLFTNTANLEVLFLDNNNLVTLPDRLFASLKKLRKLKLSKNKLTVLNETIFKNNGNLRRLYLEDNKLSELKRNIFSNLTNLLELNLQNNQLTTLHPEVFSSLSNLYSINLANNQVNMSGPRPDVSNLYNCGQIETIDLSSNSVTRIYTDWFDDLRYLKELNLSLNHINKTENLSFKSRNVNVNLTSPEYFNESLFSGNIIHDTEQFIFTQLNDVGRYCPVDCTCWHNREDEEYIVLDCRQVNVPSIKEFFEDVTKRINIIHGLANIEDVKVRLSNNSPDALEVFKSLLENIHLTYLSLTDSNLINLDNLPVLCELKILELHNNSLTILSQADIEKLQKMKDLNLNNLTLHGNPWKCDCHENVKPFVKFLEENTDLISDGITCSSGELLLEWFRDKPDPCKQIHSTMSILGYVFGCSVCSVIITWICHRFQQEIKVWMFSHKMTRWFVTEKELDRDKPYDAFVSYSHLDEWFVCNELVPELEGGSQPYKLCIHYRDWLAGAYIPTQIHNSVRDSKRTIIVLSPNFLTSFWAKMEFHEAYIKAMKERCPRVIVIVLRDIDDQVKLDDELKVYLRTYTYIKWRDPRFWDKLKYALPHKQNSKD